MKGKFDMGSAHRGRKPEEVAMDPRDMMVHPTADSNPYAPTHNNLS